MSDPFFLNRDQEKPDEPRFEALGHSGSGHYVGLEFFPNPGCGVVLYTSDEITAHCPITGQPDFYTGSIQLRETPYCIESKSLKLWLRQFASPDNGIFCEGLAVFIRDQIVEAMNLHCKRLESGELEVDAEQVTVQLDQKSRGGISIRAVA